MDDGVVTVQGRADNVIISGGEKVLLDAVERAVRAIPTLEHAVVVARADAEWGEVPVVVVDGNPSIPLGRIREQVSDRLGRAAAPAQIVRVDALPQLSSGKPDRVALARVVADRASAHEGLQA